MPLSGGLLRVPEGLDLSTYLAGLAVSAAAGVASGIAVLLAGILFVRTSEFVTGAGRYTGVGMSYIHPEHETFFFLAGCAVGFVVAVGAAVVWNRRLNRRAVTGGRAGGRGGLAVAGVGVGAVGIVMGVLSAFLGARRFVGRGAPIPPLYLAAMLLLLGLGLALAVVGPAERFTWRRAMSPPLAEGAGVPEAPAAGPIEAQRRVRPGPLDILVPLFLVAVVLVPAWRQLSGRVYLSEQWFSWDYFAMGPALAFAHGAALGTQVHAQYGVGWPVLFAWLSPLVKLSYGHMIEIGDLYGCLYFVGVYLLLRLLTRSAAWAAAGALLAVAWQLFAGTTTDWPLWQFPSLTVMRRAADVWVFLAAALYLRRGRLRWAVAAGALVGLGLVLETDTGLYLGAAFAAFWLLVLAAGDRVDLGSLDRRVRALGGALAAFLVVVVAGFEIASRGTMLSAAFWRAWWEPISFGSQGYTALPMVGRTALFGAGLPGPVTMGIFVLATAVQLGVVAWGAVLALHGRARAADLVLAFIAAYGLLSLIAFVGRSHPFNLPHTLVPFAIVLAVLAARAHRLVGAPGAAAGAGEALARGGRWDRWAWVAAPYAASALVLLVLVGDPVFTQYPGWLQSLGSSKADGVCLFAQPADACALPAADQSGAATFRQDAAAIHALATTGSVALLDYSAVYAVAAGIRPWGPYVPLFDSLFTTSQLHAAEAQLRADRPHSVLIRTAAAMSPVGMDVWADFHAQVAATYALTGEIGPYEVWQSPGP